MEPTKNIWFDGELIPWDDATVHVLAHGLHYGTGVFEGIRAYETDNGPAVFRLTDHMVRLVNSSKAYGLPIAWTSDQLVAEAKALISANGHSSCYLRPLVFYGTGSMGLNPAGATCHTMMATWEWGAYLGEEGVLNGIRVAVSSWRRIGHESFIPAAKGTGQYLNSVMAKQEALRNGYDEAILLNTDGQVSEGSGENLFAVQGGTVFTPPLSAGILDGITRNSVMDLLRDDGYTVVEKDLLRSDLYISDELFFTGTAAEVTPIREVDNRAVGAGKPGPVTKRAQELFMGVVRGENERYSHWLETV